jgi:ribosome biogenesis GTPase
LHEEDGGLADTFSDIEETAAGCRFRDCRHEQEPGCAVREACTTGDLLPERLAAYGKLLDERAAAAARNERRVDQSLQKRRALQSGKTLDRITRKQPRKPDA